MLNNFIYAQTKNLFLEKLNAGEVLNEAIVFIEDTKEIWNHGHYFAGNGSGEGGNIDPELFNEIQNAISELQNNKLNKSDATLLYATKASVDSKIDKVDGKGLSTNDFTDYYKNKLDSISDDVISITSLDLRKLKNTSALIPGGCYRIIDYADPTSASNRFAGHQFDILVFAISDSILMEDAIALQHEGDTYFSNSNLSKWRIKYNASNNEIYYMKDEFDNECPYDFKNVLYYNNEMHGYSSEDGDIIVYTFSNIIDGVVTDKSLTYQCHDNIIKPRSSDIVGSTNYSKNAIVFLNRSVEDECYGNVFKSDCKSMTFGRNCYMNEFGSDGHYNTFGDNCQFNKIGCDSFHINVGDGFMFNTIGMSSSGIRFGDDCTFNTFGNNCGSSEFGNSCSNNTIGNNCDRIKLGSHCSFNTFGNDCTECVFYTEINPTATRQLRPYCWYNTFETGSWGVSIINEIPGDENNILKNVVCKNFRSSNYITIVNGSETTKEYGKYTVFSSVVISEVNSPREIIVEKNSSNEIVMYSPVNLLDDTKYNELQTLVSNQNAMLLELKAKLDAITITEQ